MDELLSTALLFLFLGGALFSWIDWRRRARSLPAVAGYSWSCPNCTLGNEAERAICWACGAGIAGRVLFPDHAAAVETWQCGTCRAWNGTSRRTCWSCSSLHTAQKKRSA
ncbi:MAG: hypothetical protein A3K68_01105 [Euryarchaeota archaeon RBG_16_68_13]|nr:MAG: hypothetical protein A3K68_01105 [Euryarchaeota archaeon RBG_16_68_13]